MQKRLYVEEHGSPGAPSIVLLHGGGLSGRMWTPQVERLQDWHVVVPDLPEQGRSAHVKPFALDDAADRIAALIQERCPDGRAHLVGLSLGGAVALTVLQRTPELVRRVVVSGTAAGFGRVLGAISKASAGMYRLFRPEILVDMSMRQFGIPGKYRPMLQEDMVPGLQRDFIRNFTEALMSMQLPEDATAPVLVAVGERETWVAKRAARKIVASISTAQGVVVPKAGHVWNLEHPILFTDTITAWCRERPLPRGLHPMILG